MFSTSKVQIVHRQCCLVLWKPEYSVHAIIIYSKFICKIRGRKGPCNKENCLVHKGNTEGETSREGKAGTAASHKRETVKHNARLHYDMAEWREVCGPVCKIVYGICEQEEGKGWLQGLLCVSHVFTSLLKLQVL